MKRDRLEYNRKWVREHREHVRNYQRNYRAAHEDEVRTNGRLRGRRWIAENRQRHNENCRRWRETHPEKVKTIKHQCNAKIGKDAAWFELQTIAAALKTK